MRRLLTALAVLTVLLVIGPLAYASPPDQTWLVGFWDAGDYDDVIIALTGMDGMGPRALPVTGPRTAIVGTALVWVPVVRLSSALPVPLSRAPPII